MPEKEGENIVSEQQKKAQQEPDLNQLRKVRREKLADLQANGKDPFVITKYDQTHHSLEIKENFEELAGKEVSIAGRMMSKRVMEKHLSAMYRICREIFSLTLQETVSEKKLTKSLRRWMSAM